MNRKIARAGCLALGIGLLAIRILAAGDSAAPVDAAADPVPVIVELFTSEGCSSCPPADRVLADAMARSPVDGAMVIGLSEHVDYWDGQGWRDPFSSRAVTERQDRYAARFGPDTVYTPEMVVDGRTFFVGSNRAALVAALSSAVSAARAKPSPTHVSLAWTPTAQLSISVESAAPASDVIVAIAEDDLRTDVTHGENAGRTLPHAGVLRRMTTAGQIDAAGHFARTVAAPIDPAWKPRALRVIVFVQAKRQGPIAGAAVVSLPAAADPLPR